MKVYLTGANGYLGGWLVEELLGAGHDLYAVSARGELVHGYGEDAERLAAADVVVHLGWYSVAGDAAPRLQDRSLAMTEGLVQHLDWLDRTMPLMSGQTRRLIFASTASVYGHNPHHECSEAHPVKPLCAYTRAKVAAEDLIRKLIPRHVIVRLGSLMGRGRTRTKTDLLVNGCAVDGFVRRKIPMAHPDSYKPILHVRDAASLLRRLVEAPARCGTLNAAAWSLPVADVATIAAAAAGAAVEVVPATCPERSIRLSCARLRSWFPDLVFRCLRSAIEELADHVETPADRNTPWTH